MLCLVDSLLVAPLLPKPGDSAPWLSGETLPSGGGELCPVRGWTDLETIWTMAWRGPAREDFSSSKDGDVVSVPVHVCVCARERHLCYKLTSTVNVHKDMRSVVSAHANKHHGRSLSLPQHLRTDYKK